MPKSTASRPPESEAVESKEFQTKVLDVLGQMTEGQTALKDSLREIDKRVSKMEGKAPSRPEDFKPANDDAVPYNISAIVRNVLGNHVGILSEPQKGSSGYLLHIVIPESLHTQGQWAEFHQDRLDEKRDDTGRVLERKTVEWVKEDRRSIPVPLVGADEMVNAFALRVRDNIYSRFEKEKLPVPDLFKE